MLTILVPYMISCYYKSYVQTARKRGLPLPAELEKSRNILNAKKPRLEDIEKTGKGEEEAEEEENEARDTDRDKREQLINRSPLVTDNMAMKRASTERTPTDAFSFATTARDTLASDSLPDKAHHPENMTRSSAIVQPKGLDVAKNLSARFDIVAQEDIQRQSISNDDTSKRETDDRPKENSVSSIARPELLNKETPEAPLDAVNASKYTGRPSEAESSSQTRPVTRRMTRGQARSSSAT